MDPVCARAAAALGAGLSARTAPLVGATVRGDRGCFGPPSCGTTEPALGAPLYLLLFGTLGGIGPRRRASPGGCSAPLQSTYRRGGLALVSAFATVVLMLVCIGRSTSCVRRAGAARRRGCSPARWPAPRLAGATRWAAA